MNLGLKKKLDYFLGAVLIGFFKLPTMLLGTILRRDHTPILKKDVCFIKMQGGGSLVIAFPALLGLRRRYPNCRFRLVCTTSVRPFAICLGLFDEIDAIDDGSLPRLFFSGFSALMNNYRVDTIIDLEVYSRLTTVFSLLTCARNRIGFYLENTFWREHISSHLIFFNRYSGSFHFYEAIGRLLGSEPAEWLECRRIIKDSISCKDVADGIYRIAIGHACSDLGRERMLNAEQWRVVLDGYLHNSRKLEISFLGGVSDKESAEDIIQYCRRVSANHLYNNLCGQLKLVESVALLARSEEFIGIDSGLLHFARILGVKCTSFWGPTDPATRLKEFNGLDEKVFYDKCPCSPCVHVSEVPPCNGKNICISSLFDRSYANNYASVKGISHSFKLNDNGWVSE